MARFRFRLESLLRLATAQRNTRRQDLAQALQAERIVQEQIDRLEGELDRALRQRRPGIGVVDVDRLLDAAREQLLLAAQKQHLEQQLEQVRQEVRRRQQLRAEADRHVRLLERLRDKQRRRHQQQLLRQEQKLLDEIANGLNYREAMG